MEQFIPSLDLHITFILVAGGALLGMAYLPRLLENQPLSLPIIYVVSGVLLFILPSNIPLPQPMEIERDAIILEIATEILVISSLAAVGLALRRRINWTNWQSTWRLLGITMPLSILVLVILGHTILGLPLATAVLLGGVLAPTDPVLAADVQVEDLNSDEDEVRFALTSEAGLNDSLAFPFIHLAIALAGVATLSPQLFIGWFGYDVLYRIVIGLIGGYLIGKVLAWLAFDGSDEAEDSTGQNAGLVIISATLLAYGITEIFHGYGFLATFVAALVGRREEIEHDYNKKVHNFIDQTERLLLSVMLIAFGGILLSGVFTALTWKVILISVLAVFVIRPLSGLIAFIGYDISLKRKFAISFFGIRGMGSLYYLAFAINNAVFRDIEIVWATVSFTILLSIIIHGITASPIMNYLELRNKTE